jgi:uncharacterized protein (TIGR02588 family)
MAKTTESRKDSPESVQRYPAIEWVVGLASLAIVLGVLAAFGYRCLQPRLPPQVEVTVEEVQARGDQFAVIVTVLNSGDEPAAELLVQGTLRSASGQATQAQLTFDHVPGRSRRRGTLLFADDPRDGELEVRALGFRVP